ncbi:unnamed protein product [Amoebophrya sp. A120]|nr:unnamed protein product [Amoebophrya sp. A120]|eukprot:GSA120T00004835001.1
MAWLIFFGLHAGILCARAATFSFPAPPDELEALSVAGGGTSRENQQLQREADLRHDFSPAKSSTLRPALETFVSFLSSASAAVGRRWLFYDSPPCGRSTKPDHVVHVDQRQPTLFSASGQDDEDAAPAESVLTKSDLPEDDKLLANAQMNKKPGSHDAISWIKQPRLSSGLHNFFESEAGSPTASSSFGASASTSSSGGLRQEHDFQNPRSGMMYFGDSDGSPFPSPSGDSDMMYYHEEHADTASATTTGTREQQNGTAPWALEPSANYTMLRQPQLHLRLPTACKGAPGKKTCADEGVRSCSKQMKTTRDHEVMKQDIEIEMDGGVRISGKRKASSLCCSSRNETGSSSAVADGCSWASPALLPQKFEKLDIQREENHLEVLSSTESSAKKNPSKKKTKNTKDVLPPRVKHEKNATVFDETSSASSRPPAGFLAARIGFTKEVLSAVLQKETEQRHRKSRRAGGGGPLAASVWSREIGGPPPCRCHRPADFAEDKHFRPMSSPRTTPTAASPDEDDIFDDDDDLPVESFWTRAMGDCPPPERCFSPADFLEVEESRLSSPAPAASPVSARSPVARNSTGMDGSQLHFELVEEEIYPTPSCSRGNYSDVAAEPKHGPCYSTELQPQMNFVEDGLRCTSPTNTKLRFLSPTKGKGKNGTNDAKHVGPLWPSREEDLFSQFLCSGSHISASGPVGVADDVKKSTSWPAGKRENPDVVLESSYDFVAVGNESCRSGCRSFGASSMKPKQKPQPDPTRAESAIDYGCSTDESEVLEEAEDADDSEDAAEGKKRKGKQLPPLKARTQKTRRGHLEEELAGQTQEEHADDSFRSHSLPSSKQPNKLVLPIESRRHAVGNKSSRATHVGTPQTQNRPDHERCAAAAIERGSTTTSATPIEVDSRKNAAFSASTTHDFSHHGQAVYTRSSSSSRPRAQLSLLGDLKNPPFAELTGRHDPLGCMLPPSLHEFEQLRNYQERLRAGEGEGSQERAPPTTVDDVLYAPGGRGWFLSSDTSAATARSRTMKRQKTSTIEDSSRRARPAPASVQQGEERK